MDNNSYLNPTTMKEQCDNAIRKLEKDNEAIRVSESKLNEFLNDTEIESEAFRALRQQMSDYITVLQAMRTANHADIADFNTLKSAVGDEVLWGENILRQKEAALRQKEADEDTAERYEKEAKNAFWIWEKWYYGWKADEYWDMAEIDWQLYLLWKDKEERYDAIESATCGLFTTAVSMRSAIEAGLSAIGSAFQNGAYVTDSTASWRADLAKSYMERIVNVGADGTITANWKEVENVLHKPAEEITPEEYEALALLYLNIDETELGYFLGLCMDRTSDVDVAWYEEMIRMGSGFSGKDYSEWTVNKEKVDKLLEQVAITSDNTLLAMRVTDSDEMKHKLLLHRNIIIQRMTLLNAAEEIGVFRGDYQAISPTINIKKNQDESLTMSFRQFRNIGSEFSPTYSELGKAKVEISRTQNGVNVDNEERKNIEKSFYRYFGGTSVAEQTGEFVADEAKGELIGQGAEQLGAYVAEKTGKEALGHVIGYVPIAGDVAEFVIDVKEAEQEAKENREFISGQFDSLESADIYSEFNCSVSFAEYDTTDKQEITVYAHKGSNTDMFVRNVNEAMETQITEDEVVKNPNGINELKKKLFEENPENADKYNDAIKLKE